MLLIISGPATEFSGQRFPQTAYLARQGREAGRAFARFNSVCCLPGVAQNALVYVCVKFFPFQN
jgi:hypothetical protein